MSDALVLSLGHNSSAVLVRDHKIVGGYETERLTGVKSDSAFPKLPIEELDRRFAIKRPCDVYVSHWELFGEVKRMKAKHWDPKFVEQISGEKARLFETSQAFTHHDAHAWSAVLFAGDEFPSAPQDSSFVFVMDGFGTLGEHMSFYRLVDGKPILLERKYGFGSSMGLFYQYTTGFLGMKQNQDEYKILAYEAHIEKVPIKIELLDEAIEAWTDFYLRQVSAYMEPDVTDPLLDVGALPNVAKSVADTLTGVVKSVHSGASERERRVICSHFAQRVVENVVQAFVDKYRPRNLLLAGGLFYNVKVNSMVADSIDGKLCVMPLAGDQGAALGLYKAVNPDLEWPGHLFWGPRDLSREFFDQPEMREMGVLYFENREAAFDAVAAKLRSDKFVNLVEGEMEYGPRALCHTTTFGIPDATTADAINAMNNRVGEMPFAPCMTEEQSREFLVDCDKVHRSLDYMICTRRYFDGKAELVHGAAHRYPRQRSYSGRPQIVRDPLVVKLLEEFGPLINTSWNFHGQPIVCTNEQVRHCHVMERNHTQVEGTPTTIVVGDKS